MIHSTSSAYFEAEKPNKRNSFLEKLETGFFGNNVLNIVVGRLFVANIRNTLDV